jgi:hypothetical protein
MSIKPFDCCAVFVPHVGDKPDHDASVEAGGVRYQLSEMSVVSW